MAHFAKIGIGNIVEQVVVLANDVIKDENNVEQENKGVQFLQELYQSRDIWKQTSYNTRGCLLYTSPSPRDRTRSRMPSSA